LLLARLAPRAFRGESPTISATLIVSNFVFSIDGGNDRMAATHSLGDVIEAHISSGEQANNPVNLKVIQRASLNWHCLSPLDNECVNMNMNGEKSNKPASAIFGPNR